MILAIWFTILAAAVMIVAAGIGLNAHRQMLLVNQEREALAAWRQELEAWGCRLSAAITEPRRYRVVGERELWTPDDDDRPQLPG